MMVIILPFFTLWNCSKKAKNDNAILIEFHYEKRDLSSLYELENKIREAVNIAKVGEYDGHEISIKDSLATLYIYGQDAKIIFASSIMKCNTWGSPGECAILSVYE